MDGENLHHFADEQAGSVGELVKILSKNCTLTDRIQIKVKENQIESETQVDLSGLKIDNRLSSDSHISAI